MVRCDVRVGAYPPEEQALDPGHVFPHCTLELLLPEELFPELLLPELLLLELLLPELLLPLEVG